MPDNKTRNPAAAPSIFTPDETALPADDTPPIFDQADDSVPWTDDDVLPMDDDGNILPGGDDIDDDPNDNGGAEAEDIADLPHAIPADTYPVPADKP